MRCLPWVDSFQTFNFHNRHIALNITWPFWGDTSFCMREALQRSFYRYCFFLFVKTNIFQATKPQNTRHQLFLLRTNNILKPWLTIIIATQPIPKKPGKSESFPPSRGAGAAAKKGGNMKVGDEKYFSQKHICCSDWDANERWRLGLLQVRLLHQVRSRHPEGPLNLQQSRRCTASSLLCLHNMESSTFKYKFSTQNKTDSLMIRTNI